MIAAFPILLWALAVFILLRNNMTYRVRTRILWSQPNGLEMHDRLPSYDRMVIHPAYWLKWTEADWREYIGRRP